MVQSSDIGFQLINPIMFAHLENRTYFLFAGLNLSWMPIVFFFYPETKDRSLESIDAMFTTSSPLYTEMERAYARHADVLTEKSDGKLDSRKRSVEMSEDTKEKF